MCQNETVSVENSYKNVYTIHCVLFVWFRNGACHPLLKRNPPGIQRRRLFSSGTRNRLFQPTKLHMSEKWNGSITDHDRNDTKQIRGKGKQMSRWEKPIHQHSWSHFRVLKRAGKYCQIRCEVTSTAIVIDSWRTVVMRTSFLTLLYLALVAFSRHFEFSAAFSVIVTENENGEF